MLLLHLDAFSPKSHKLNTASLLRWPNISSIKHLKYLFILHGLVVTMWCFMGAQQSKLRPFSPKDTSDQFDPIWILQKTKCQADLFFVGSAIVMFRAVSTMIRYMSCQGQLDPDQTERTDAEKHRWSWWMHVCAMICQTMLNITTVDNNNRYSLSMSFSRLWGFEPNFSMCKIFQWPWC